MSAAPGPLRQVLDAFSDGVHSVDEIVQRTGLSRGVVDASIDHLVRSGRLEARQLTVGCPDGGCGSCASGTAAGAPGCGAAAPSQNRSGPVLVTLQLRRP